MNGRLSKQVSSIYIFVVKPPKPRNRDPTMTSESNNDLFYDSQGSIEEIQSEEISRDNDTNIGQLTKENNTMLKEILKELKLLKRRVEKLEERNQMEWKVERAKCKHEYLCYLKSYFTRHHYLYYDDLPREFVEKVKSLLTSELGDTSSSNLQKMVCYALKKFSNWRGDIRTKLLRSQSNRGLEIKELNKLLWKPYFPIESINLEITLKKSLMMRAFAHSKDLFGRIGSRQDQAGNNFWANFDSFFQRCIEDRREGKWETWFQRDERRRLAFLGEE
ncbi:uncharacterized protein [Ptychodera flava]